MCMYYIQPSSICIRMYGMFSTVVAGICYCV